MTDQQTDIPSDDGQLRSIVERLERMEAERQDAADGIKDIYTEAKSNGFDAGVLRKVVARRKRDRDAVAEEDSILDLYENALEGRG